MLEKPATFVYMLIFIGLMFFTSIAFAYEPLSMTQSYGGLSNDRLESVSADKEMGERLKEMVFEQSLDRYLSYPMGINRSAGFKIHSSVGLKLRSDETFVQFRMSF